MLKKVFIQRSTDAITCLSGPISCVKLCGQREQAHLKRSGTYKPMELRLERKLLTKEACCFLTNASCLYCSSIDIIGFMKRGFQAVLSVLCIIEVRNMIGGQLK